MNDQRPLDAAKVAEVFAALRSALAANVIGHDEAVRLSFVTLLCSGHSLYEGVPGLAKTLLVRALAATLGIRFGRIQCTADLLPSDIIGTPVLRADTGDFRFRPGPLFTDLLLVDEVNRAPAKTQAALLEAMQERAVTVDGVRHGLGEWFTVLATQNPVEQEGTYPLPEAELDRFLFKIIIGYPSAEEEVRVLATHHGSASPALDAKAILDAGALAAARAAVNAVIAREEILQYAVSLVRATRDHPAIAVGASTRAALLMVRGAKAVAVLEGRDFVLPEDIQAVMRPALRHRVVLEPSAEVEGMLPDNAVEEVIRAVPVPH
ncbi:MAG TPA: MoxR family ATPase [Candidatus Binataceae bacterium]|nr:MoxR family ATPase [Candidatus Binataceae bacterium]